MNETPSPVIREATLEDCRAVELFLRKADRETIRTATGLSHEDGVVATFQASAQRFAIVFDGKPIALLGAADLGDSTGSPWLLATGRLKPFIPLLLQAMPEMVANLQRVYGTLPPSPSSGSTRSRSRWTSRVAGRDATVPVRPLRRTPPPSCLL